MLDLARGAGEGFRGPALLWGCCVFRKRGGGEGKQREDGDAEKAHGPTLMRKIGHASVSGR